MPIQHSLKGSQQVREVPLRIQATKLVRKDTDSRTIELAFSSEYPYERSWGIEILDHSLNALDLSRLQSGGAVLMDHNWVDQVGVVESVRIDPDRVARAVVRFSRSVRGQEVLNDILDGIRTNISVGYIIDDLSQIDSADSVPTYRVTRWTPYEISIVSVPADPTVGIGRSATRNLNPQAPTLKSTKENTMTKLDTRFSDLIQNAKPEKTPTFDKDDNFKGFRQNNPEHISVDLDDPIIQAEEMKALPSSVRAAFMRDHTTSNSPNIANSAKTNLTTWKHMIISSGVLARAGMSIDTSGNFEGFPFFPGFDSFVSTTWLGENAEIPESSAVTAQFPYQIHTIGAFTIVSRRLKVLSSHVIPQVKVAQANGIKEAVELALINGDSTIDTNQPNGLVKKVIGNVLSGATKSGLIILGEALEVLEGNGLDKNELSVILSPDVAKKWRLETGSKTHKALSLPNNRILVSKHMPAGTAITGRYSDYQAVMSPKIDFLAHTYTPKGLPETGATRIRSMFDVDSVVLNQESFVKTTNI